jgi:hypothetical protein
MLKLEGAREDPGHLDSQEVPVVCDQDTKVGLNTLGEPVHVDLHFALAQH